MTSAERRALALAALLAAPPAGRAGALLDHESQPEAIESPTPAAFTVCSDHGCARRSRVALPAAAWAPVRDVFAPPPRNAVEERARIARAIGLLERIVGPLTDTASDRAGDLNGFTAPGYQMDCIDESTNATTYLRMFEADGLLAFHRAGEPQGRGWFVTGFPHWTASVVERGTGRGWAVDSWFLDNGREPPVVPLAEWRDGWEPKD
jgi:hypothetical protein